MSAKETVFLVDGSGYIFRAYYAIRHLSNSKGTPTNAVYGFANMLLKLIREHQPTHLGMAFDTKEKTFRHKMYTEYKANRPPPPEDLIPQFALIHKLVEALGIRILVKPGYEADDLIGTAARIAVEKGHEVVVVTADKDMMQLVGDQVSMLDEMRAARNGGEIMIDRQGVIEKFGVPPEHVIDVLALAGDKSDNVPGVPGIGEKTAAQLVNEYGDVDAILAAAPQIKQKGRREKLIDNADMARLSKELVIIDQHADYPLEVSDLNYNGPKTAELKELLAELEFTRLLEDPVVTGDDAADAGSSVATSAGSPASDGPVDYSAYEAVCTPQALSALIKKLKKADRIGLDTETDSLKAVDAVLVGISLSWEEGQGAYIPLAHQPEAVPEQLDLAEVRQALEPILTDPKKTVIAQHAKFDLNVLVHAGGFAPFAIQGDPMLARIHLDHQPIKFEEVCGKGKTAITFDAVPLEKAVPYAAEDADIALRLANIIEPELKAASLDGLYREMELPLEEVLARMEANGIKLDTKRLDSLQVEFAAELEKIVADAHAVAGREFNLKSPKQVGALLFDELNLPVIKKTKTGPSTDQSVLEALAPRHELPALILRHRLVAKLKGTYVDTLPEYVSAKTRRLHTHYNQSVAATGRLASSDPNLQNIPIRSPEGRRIREAFVSEKGQRLISLDYSQVELRILAHVSEDPVMRDSFLQGEDVHQRTASEIFDIPLGDVSRDQRASAKTINFGLLYGMGVHRLGQTLGIPRKEAQAYLDAYWSRYDGIRKWHAETLAKAHEEGEVRTLFGRRRKLPELASRNRMLVQRAERIAINTPIQGTAADLIKKAMIDVDREIRKKMPNAKLLLQVHDELVLEAPTDEAESVKTAVADLMENAVELAVPLLVDGGIATTWAKAH
jgi:DNA polymerase-1